MLIGNWALKLERQTYLNFLSGYINWDLSGTLEETLLENQRIRPYDDQGQQ